MTASSLALSPLIETAPQKFAARSLLPLKPNSLWKIETGLVRTLTWLEDGTIVVLGVWGAGDVVGKVLSKVEPFQVEALTGVEATPLSIASLPNPSNLLTSYVQQYEELIAIRSYKRTDVMLLKLLNWLAKRFGQQSEQGRLLDLRLTHLDLSELLGSTRVTVTRTLNQLEQQGLIQRLSLKRIVLHEEEVWHYEI